MGYETELLIGISSSSASDEIKYGELIVADEEAYRPMMRNAKNNTIKTGRKETYFSIYATIDLCKCGGREINNLDRINKDTSHHWYWYTGNGRTVEDCYGDKLKPVPIIDVINAIEQDSFDNDYRRFEWALALLNSMKNDTENLSVLLRGH
jgi:hypothetical protein